MDRRTFLAGALGATVACSIPGRPGARARLPQRPNIVLVMADDLGYGDLGLTGRSDYATPSIDSIARDGVTLTQAYSIAPVCTPTRVGLMTGRYPARSPVGLHEPLIGAASGLSPVPPTLPRLLRDAGYQTALVGKWHLGTQPQFNPLNHGFDEFFGFTAGGVDYASHVARDLGGADLHDGHAIVEREGYLTDLLTERAVDVIGRAREPFFLSLQYNAPHWPWQAPGDPPYPDSVDQRAGGSAETFAAMMRSLDDGVGRVLESIRRSGHADNTLVVFTSDNGGERYSSMGPFRHGKMTVWEGGIRVAAAARWPAMIRAGTSCEQPCTTLDWTATFLAIGGATPDAAAPLDGMDLRPQLTGTAPITQRDLFWRVHQRRQQKAVRSGDWKYIQDEEGEHLFHLASDPGEATNRATAEPARLQTLRTALAGWEAEVLPPIPLQE